MVDRAALVVYSVFGPVHIALVTGTKRFIISRYTLKDFWSVFLSDELLHIDGRRENENMLVYVYLLHLRCGWNVAYVLLPNQ